MADDIVTEAVEALDHAWVEDRENRIEAYRDLQFLAGDQWPADVRLERERQHRPCLTINRLPQFVNQVANDVRKNPPAIKAVPAGNQATVELAEIYSGLFRQIQYRSNATHTYATALYYAVACGIGHFRLKTDYADDSSFDQELFIEPIAHPLSVFWDPDARKIDRSDANYCVATETMSPDAFKKRFPHAEVVDFNAPRADQNSGLFWTTRDAIRIAEYWKKEPQIKTMARTAAGQVIDITAMKKLDLSQLQIIATRKVKSHKVRRYLVSGMEVLEGPTEWAGRIIPIFPVIGSEVALEEKVIRMGLIRFARDPQQLYNYARSAAAETIALQPRAPFLATPQMIAKFKGQWDTQNTVSRPYLLYEPDPDAPGARPQREPPPPIPAAFVQESQLAQDEMKAATGIYDAALGARSNEISGVAIHARETQGDTATLHYQDNLVATLHHLGTALVELVPKIYDNERVVRILQEDETTPDEVRINQQIMSVDGTPMLLNDLNQGVYDVRVKVGPAYATKRAESAESMLQFVQAVPQAAQIIGDLIARNMDWPGAEAIAERLQKVLPPQLSDQPPPPQVVQQQQQQQAMQQAMAQAEIAEKQGRANKAQAEGLRAHIEAQRMAQGADIQPNAPQNSPAQMQAQDQGAALKNALLYQTLRRASAQADKAAVDTQGAALKNEIARAQALAGAGGFAGNL